MKDGPVVVEWEKYEDIFEVTVSIAQRSGKEEKEPYLLVMPSMRNWN